MRLSIAVVALVALSLASAQLEVKVDASGYPVELVVFPEPTFAAPSIRPSIRALMRFRSINDLAQHVNLIRFEGYRQNECALIHFP